MRWLVGWSSVAAGFASTTGPRAGSVSGSYGSHGSYGGNGSGPGHASGPGAGHGSGSGAGYGSGSDAGYGSGPGVGHGSGSGAGRGSASPHGYGGRTSATEGRTVQPVGAQLLWGDPDPLWAVGDWRPDEVRVIAVDDHTRLAVLGCCAASDEELRLGLLTARGGALRHLTAWPGSYTAVVKAGRRVTVTGDLAGARPVFHTPWDGGTAFATAALPLADLVEAQLDIGHLAALLACPETPEALRDTTPYEGVRRVPPGHALILREGSREITGYEQVASLAVAAAETDPRQAVEGVRDALIEAVRARLT
ncbi:asparagine synthase, partial [Streptomyces sp. SID6041]|nr:asparagine synthase [Streptomyces sp. SID6041]